MAKRLRANNNKALVATPNTDSTHDADLHSLVVSPLLVDELDSTDDDRTHNRTDAALPQTAGETPVAASANAKGKGAATPTGNSSSSSDNKHVMLPAFLSKTYEIFCMPEFASICGWNASGDTIIVAQLEAFVARVLPRFFKHRNFPSFVRQLNLYGFHKTVLDSKRLEFQHPYFKRDRPDLLHYIKRKVSSGTTAAQQQQQQALVTSTAQNSRLEAHREISENLLREMKELRQRSDHMEKRLRELEIDNAIVRSDNVKLWKHLETAKDKQLIMQEKLKKIMWILFQIYRGKQGIPKLSGSDAANAISEDSFANSSLLGPKEFREVLRYLAMDEPPLLPSSSSSAVVVDSSASPSSRKRKFVEVPADGQLDQFGNDVYKFDPPSGNDNRSLDHSSAMMLASIPSSPSTSFASHNPTPAAAATASVPTSPSRNSSALSIFSPNNALGPRTEFANSDLNQLIANAMSSSLTNYDNALVAAAAAAAANGSTGHQQQQQLMSHAAGATDHSTNSSSTNNTNVLDLIDDELPLLSDSETYNFGEGEEQQVMKKLEDFETSLLDEYDVGCLDTLLQQLKSSSMGKPAADVSVIDPEEIFVGGAATASSPRNA